jgi:crotonobetainyl-CoA:carnitine CoA-transferase CaiB-like acyl-CoA transferase
VQNREEMLARISAALSADTAASWVSRLTARGVPCGVVNRVDEAIELAVRLGLEPVVEMTDDQGREWRQARSPITFAGSSESYRTAPVPVEELRPLEELLSDLPN